MGYLSIYSGSGKGKSPTTMPSGSFSQGEGTTVWHAGKGYAPTLVASPPANTGRTVADKLDKEALHVGEINQTTVHTNPIIPGRHVRLNIRCKHPFL